MPNNLLSYSLKIIKTIFNDPYIITDLFILRSKEKIVFEHRKRRKRSDTKKIIEVISKLPIISITESLKSKEIMLLQEKFLERGFRDYHILLALLHHISKPKTIVESGVAVGVSSYFTLSVFDQNIDGTLYSIDLPTEEYRTNIGWIVPTRLKKKWNLILGTSKDHLLRILNNLQTIDMFCHDSEHSYECMLFEYRTSWPFIKENGFIISDDINDSKAFDDFISELPANSIITGKFGDSGFIQKNQ